MPSGVADAVVRPSRIVPWRAHILLSFYISRIAPFGECVLCWTQRRGSITRLMQRLTARFLLLLALAGTFVPVALQATAAPLRACCRRNAAHHCTDSKVPSDAPVLRDAGCCNHNCCHAVTTSQWAHPQPSHAAATVQNTAVREIDLASIVPATERFSARSSRAPPSC